MSIGGTQLHNAQHTAAVCRREPGVGSHFAAECDGKTVEMNRHFVNSRNNLLPSASDK